MRFQHNHNSFSLFFFYFGEIQILVNCTLHGLLNYTWRILIIKFEIIKLWRKYHWACKLCTTLYILVHGSKWFGPCAGLGGERRVRERPETQWSRRWACDGESRQRKKAAWRGSERKGRRPWWRCGVPQGDSRRVATRGIDWSRADGCERLRTTATKREARCGAWEKTGGQRKRFGYVEGVSRRVATSEFDERSPRWRTTMRGGERSRATAMACLGGRVSNQTARESSMSLRKV